MSQDVIVVIGAGGIGLAIARRQGSGRRILLADLNEQVLATARTALEDAGHEAQTHTVDASRRDSVRVLAEKAAELGPVMQVIHTAGLSPAQARSEAVLAVDLYGTAVVLDEFAEVIAPGGAGLVVSSMAGYMFPLSAEQEQLLSSTPTEELLKLPFVAAVDNSGLAYGVSKRANHLRVQAAAATTWGGRGARVNSISPGIILTPLARDELNSANAEGYQSMIRTSAAGRVGTVDEIAATANFLLERDSAFMTGADLLIDGGVIAAMRTGRLAEARAGGEGQA